MQISNYFSWENSLILDHYILYKQIQRNNFKVYLLTNIGILSGNYKEKNKYEITDIFLETTIGPLKTSYGLTLNTVGTSRNTVGPSRITIDPSGNTIGVSRITICPSKNTFGPLGNALCLLKNSLSL